jgi:AcrR family transcriptional regulator
LSPHELSRTRRARRTLLLETAQLLFLRDGYNATTMEGIAAAADVSKATLYKYFPDKDELFFALVSERYLAPDHRLLDRLHETLSQTVAHLRDRGSQAEVEQAILYLLRLASERRNDAFYRMLIELAFANPALLERVRQALLADRPGALLALTAEAAAELPAELDGQALLHLLFVAIHGYMMIGDVVFGEERVDPERLASTLATLICSALK